MGENELFIYGLFIAVFLLFNYIMQQAAKRARQRKEQEPAQQQDAAPSPEDEPLEHLWGRRPQADLPAPVEPARRVAAITAAPAPSPAHAARRALFRSREDLRHAVVVMTVLGPCRALEPHDRR